MSGSSIEDQEERRVRAFRDHGKQEFEVVDPSVICHICDQRVGQTEKERHQNLHLTFHHYIRCGDKIPQASAFTLTEHEWPNTEVRFCNVGSTSLKIFFNQNWHVIDRLCNSITLAELGNNLTDTNYLKVQYGNKICAEYIIGVVKVREEKVSLPSRLDVTQIRQLFKLTPQELAVSINQMYGSGEYDLDYWLLQGIMQYTKDRPLEAQKCWQLRLPKNYNRDILKFCQIITDQRIQELTV